MPQSANSPTSTNSKAGSDDNSSGRLSEAALRKKKNADAQAAFRARRANYIATLEETGQPLPHLYSHPHLFDTIYSSFIVTNLEAVVLQLQDSCREAKNDATELRSENARLRNEGRERERFWRALWQAKKTPHTPDTQTDDFPIPPYGSVHTPPSGVVPPMNSNVNHYADDGLRFSSGSNPSPSIPNASYHPAATPEYTHRSPAIPYAVVDHEGAPDGRAQHMDSHRVPRYGPYPYPVESSARDGAWPQSAAPGNDPASMDNGSCPSPTFVESPSLTSSDLTYSSRFSVAEDQKVPITPITTPYMFPTSRSMSPAASTPTSTSSTSLAPAPYQFSFPEGSVVQDRPEFGGFRRQGSNHGHELTLHGGTADIPLATSGGDALRFRLGNRANSTSERAVVQPISPYSRTENGSHERESDETDSAPYHYSTRARQRRSTATSRTSRSPSPGPPPICGTLAVIKAQAFGALRRTRTRTKKSSEGAAKAAVEALEARGIGMGIAVGSAAKRPRLHHDDGDMQP